MRPKLMRLALAAVAVLLCTAAPAGAHFYAVCQIDHDSALSVRPNEVVISYRLTCSELAAVEELQYINADGDSSVTIAEINSYVAALAGRIIPNLTLTANGVRLALQPWGKTDLSTPMTKVFTFVGALPASAAAQGVPTQIVYRDENDFSAPGESRIRVRAEQDVRLGEVLRPAGETAVDPRSADPNTPTLMFHERQITLRAVLRPAANEADSRVLAAGAPRRPGAASPAGPARRSEELKNLVLGWKGGWWYFLVALAAAAFLGGVHALQPGHAKTIVAAYLVGSRGTTWHAVVLGLVVTLTHTGSVILMGLLFLLVSRRAPERVGPWLGLASGLLIAALGVWMLIQRLRRGLGPLHPHPHHHAGDDRTGDEHSSGPDHDHASPHPQTQPGPLGLPGLISLGISGGMVPCLDAIAVLLLAVNLRRLGLGLILLLSFSAGLAVVLIAVGVAMVLAKSVAARFSAMNRATRWLPVLSALIVAVLGLVMAVQSLMAAGVLVLRVNL